MTFPCGFISIVKSVCKTQLGNQLSSFATLVYFQVSEKAKKSKSFSSLTKDLTFAGNNVSRQVKYGMRAFLDPAQTRALGQVFDKATLGIGEDFALTMSGFKQQQ